MLELLWWEVLSSAVLSSAALSSAALSSAAGNPILLHNSMDLQQSWTHCCMCKGYNYSHIRSHRLRSLPSEHRGSRLLPNHRGLAEEAVLDKLPRSTLDSHGCPIAKTPTSSSKAVHSQWHNYVLPLSKRKSTLSLLGKNIARHPMEAEGNRQDKTGNLPLMRAHICHSHCKLLAMGG